MKVLLIHPEDKFSPPKKIGRWDLVVDLGRAPLSVYRSWSRRAGCPVTSLYEFAQEVEDLHVTRNLVKIGAGFLKGARGIDWWNVLAPVILSELYQIILIHRLAKSINRVCDISSSRGDYRAKALHRLLGGSLENSENSFRSVVRKVRHYSGIPSTFNFSQIVQISQDKFDRDHAIRRRFARRTPTPASSSILFPSAYSNVSRTALSYAALLPDQHFLLVCARDNASLRDLPGNVKMKSLNAYFAPPDSVEVSRMLDSWSMLKTHLISSAPEYISAATVGVLDQIPSLIRWGLVLQTAWSEVFKSENIQSCFCADHSNPYTKIPLLLAKHTGLPAVAGHHGALDAWMAITSQDGDFYIAKSDMERDYMLNVCGIEAAKVIKIAPPAAEQIDLAPDLAEKPWLVFFSEPYDSWSWRKDEVYLELLPRLSTLAQICGLKLVFKLHPFESAKGHRKLLKQHLSADKVRQIQILTGPISEELWRKCRYAITAQSSVVVECTARKIPTFLCGWLQDLSSGYVQQYVKFGKGRLLETPDQILEIPRLAESAVQGVSPEQNPRTIAEGGILKEILAHHRMSVSAD